MFRGGCAVLFLALLTFVYISGGVSHQAFWGTVAISVALTVWATLASYGARKGEEEERIQELRRIREGKPKVEESKKIPKLWKIVLAVLGILWFLGLMYYWWFDWYW